MSEGLRVLIVEDNPADADLMRDALRESEERFKKLFVEAPLGIALIDSLTGRIYELILCLPKSRAEQWKKWYKSTGWASRIRMMSRKILIIWRCHGSLDHLHSFDE